VPVEAGMHEQAVLPIDKKIRFKKIGGTLYYNKEDIKRLLEEGY
jgi:hypothetical protein